MRSVIRKPSIKKSVSARTTGRVTRTVKKISNPAYGKEGVGRITNPKKALYNKFYNKTSYGIQDVVGFGQSNNAASSSCAKPLKPSETYIITNHNISDLVREYPQLISTFHRQCVKRILLGVLLISIACLFILITKSQFLFTLGFILLGIAIYQLYKGNQYRNAYLDAKECIRKLRS